MERKERIHSLIERYLGHLVLRNLSGGTVSNRRAHLRDFAVYLERRKCYEIQGVRAVELREYFSYLRNGFVSKSSRKPLSPSSINDRCRSIFSFFRYLEKTGVLLYNPMLSIERPKGSARLKRVPLEEWEMESYLSMCNILSKCGLRDRALFELIYSTGIRSGELFSLSMIDMDLSEGIVHVRRGKGRKARMVPVGRVAGFYLKRYIEEVRPYFTRKNPSSIALFLSQTGAPLDAQALWRLVKKYRERAGIKKNVTPHIIRHTFASHMLSGGADLSSISEMLGHTKLSTTQVYVHPSKESLKVAHRRCHPRG